MRKTDRAEGKQPEGAEQHRKPEALRPLLSGRIAKDKIIIRKIKIRKNEFLTHLHLLEK